MNLRQDANQIIKESINRVLPDEAVRRVLMGSDLFGKKSGRIYLVAVGKAAWQMAAAAQIILGEKNYQRDCSHKVWTCTGRTARDHLSGGGTSGTG